MLEGEGKKFQGRIVINHLSSLICSDSVKGKC